MVDDTLRLLMVRDVDTVKLDMRQARKGGNVDTTHDSHVAEMDLSIV